MSKLVLGEIRYLWKITILKGSFKNKMMIDLKCIEIIIDGKIICFQKNFEKGTYFTFDGL